MLPPQGMLWLANFSTRLVDWQLTTTLLVRGPRPTTLLQGAFLCIVTYNYLSMSLRNSYQRKKSVCRPSQIHVYKLQQTSSLLAQHKYSETNSGASAIGTQDLYKGHYLRSQIIAFPIVLTHFAEKRTTSLQRAQRLNLYGGWVGVARAPNLVNLGTIATQW